MPLQGQREDLEIALAREDDGEEAAVWGDVEFADGNAAEDWLRRWCEDRDVFAGCLRGELRNIYPDQVTGFSFYRALEHDAIFVGGPVENAEAHAKAHEVIGGGEVANFENFSINEVGGFLAARRYREATSVAIECSDFLGVLGKEFQALQAWRAGLRTVLFDGDGGIGARDAVRVDEGAAFECGAGWASGNIHVAEGEELARLDGFIEIDDRGIVLKPGGVVAVLDDALTFAEVKFFAAVFEGERLEGVFGATFFDDGGGEKLREDQTAVGGPMEGIDGVGEKFFAAVELVALKEAASFAVGVLNPDIVVLQIVFFSFDVAADGVGDASVGSEAEGGDFFVDVL